jgi:tripartite-type tricarboxylate transporter receptor subunit TctC
VPYRGNAPAVQDLVTGQIDLIFNDLSALAQVRAGTIKALAVTSRHRSPAAPDVPTTDEAGLPGFSLVSWNAIFTPEGTPKDVVRKLNDAVGRTLADPAVDQTLANLGYEVPPRDRQTPESLRAFHKAEIEKWWPIIKAAGIKGE